MKTLAIDFDGVIHKYTENWCDGRIYDEPMEGAIESLKKLSTQYKVVIFTTRKDKKAIVDWLVKHDFNQSIKITNEKIQAQAYIDDRGVRFTNWPDIMKLFYSSKN